MKQFAIALLTAAMFTGCATHSRVLTRANTSAEQANKDLQECEYDAIRYAGTHDTSYRSLFGQSLELELRRMTITKQCMNVRGYAQQR